MNKRYIICVDNLDKEQSTNVTNYFKQSKYGWWHWISNTWFVTDNQGVSSAAELRDEIKKLLKDKKIIVIELSEDGDRWAGVTDNDPEKKMFKWLHNSWKKTRDK